MLTVLLTIAIIIGAFLGLIIALFLFYIISALCVNPNKEYNTNSKYYRSILNFATAIGVIIIRIKIHNFGLDKIPKNSRYLLVCNHMSKFDPILTWLILKNDNIAFISKEENFNVPIFGKIIRKCCFMSIDRENPRNAMKTILRAADLMKKDEVSVGVYPEGTRSFDGKLLPFHNGVLKIAQRANVPIVVTTVYGTNEIHKNFPLHRSHIYFDVIDVIPADVVKSARTNELADDIKDKMSKNLSKYLKEN